MRRIGWVALPLLLAAGCVSKSKYLELEDQVDACRERTEAQQARIHRLEEALAKARREDDAWLAEIRKEFKPLIDKGILEVNERNGRIVIGMSADVLFPSGSADLSPEGRGHVVEVARVLARRSDRDFQVEGHTDSDPISTPAFPNNWWLGAARAIHVTDVMVDHGMPPARISAATFGQHHPVAGNDGPGKARNRRIEIVLLPGLPDLTGDDAPAPGGKAGPPPRKRKKRGS